jgi:hypothetical protein
VVAAVTLNPAELLKPSSAPETFRQNQEAPAIAATTRDREQAASSSVFHFTNVPSHFRHKR